MFENVREDIKVGVRWHSVPGVRRVAGRYAEVIAGVLLSPQVEVVLIYRLQAWLRSKHVMILPGLCQRLTILLGAVSIGDQVKIGPGLLLGHGNVTIDGTVEIGHHCQIMPFVTIGLDTGGPDPKVIGPVIGDFVFLGTGAKVLGRITIGNRARVGANAVVMRNVPADSTAVGVPARILMHDAPFGRSISSQD